MIRLYVNEHDMEALRRKLTPDVLLGPGIRKMFLDAGQILKKAAQAEAPKDTGALRTHHVTRVDPRPVPMWTTITNTQPYAENVYDGRKPGSRQPPTSAILGWMRRHGIPEKAAFLVARAIGRKGIKPNHWLDRAEEKTRSQVEALRTKAEKAIEAVWNSTLG